MRIYDTPQHPSAVDAAGQTRRSEVSASGKRPGKAASAQSRGDEVHLSEAASRYAASPSDAAARQERVAHLAALYQQGSYSADPEAVAGSIIDDSIQIA